MGQFSVHTHYTSLLLRLSLMRHWTHFVVTGPIYWYYLIGNIDIANIDYEVSISLSLVLLHAYFIATYWIWKSMRQVCSRSIWDMNIHDEESAAGLLQTLHHTERVCGRSAASHAADLPQTLHHTERVCGKSAASLQQN